MSWFMIEGVNHQTRQRSVRLCQGYINDKFADFEKIRLPPKLYREFKYSEEVKIQPLKHDVLNTLNR